MLESYLRRETRANEFNNSLRGRFVNALLSNEYVAGLVEIVGRIVGPFYGVRRGIAVGALGGATVLSGAGCDDDVSSIYFPPSPPVAAATATPNRGPKPLNGVVINGLASSQGTGNLTQMRVDVDGDGIDDYTGSSLVTAVNYPTQGDFLTIVTVRNSSGLEDATAVDIDVGYGNDNTGAADYIDGILTADGYTCTRNQDCHIPDLRAGSPGTMHFYIADVKGTISDEIKYVIYDLSKLTPDDLAIIAAFNAQMAATGVPRSVVVVNPDHSPDGIDSLLSE